jgi:hypothetical protein
MGRLSLNPAEFLAKGGGFFPAGPAKVNKSEFTIHQFKNKEGVTVGKPATFLHLNLTALQDDKKSPKADKEGEVITRDQYYRVGQPESVVPADEDGNISKSSTGPHVTLTPKPVYPGIGKDTEFAVFVESLLNSNGAEEYPLDRWEENGAYGLNGCILDLYEIPSPLDQSWKTKKDDTKAPAMVGPDGKPVEKKEQKPKEEKILVVRDVLHVPEGIEEATEFKASTKSAAAKGGKVNGAAKPAPAKEEAADADGDVDDIATALLTDALESAPKAKNIIPAVLRADITKAAADLDADQRTAVIARIKDNEFLASVASTVGWTLEGNKLVAAK